MKDDFLTYEVAFVGVFPVKYVSVVYQNVRLGELSLMVQRSARDSMTLATKARKFVSGLGLHIWKRFLFCPSTFGQGFSGPNLKENE